MSAKLFTKLGVQDMDEVIHSVNSIAGNREGGGFMMDHITSCNKVSCYQCKLNKTEETDLSHKKESRLKVRF